MYNIFRVAWRPLGALLMDFHPWYEHERCQMRGCVHTARASRAKRC